MDLSSSLQPRIGIGKQLGVLSFSLTAVLAQSKNNSPAPPSRSRRDGYFPFFLLCVGVGSMTPMLCFFSFLRLVDTEPLVLLTLSPLPLRGWHANDRTPFSSLLVIEKSTVPTFPSPFFRSECQKQSANRILSPSFLSGGSGRANQRRISYFPVFFFRPSPEEDKESAVFSFFPLSMDPQMANFQPVFPLFPFLSIGLFRVQEDAPLSLLLFSTRDRRQGFYLISLLLFSFAVVFGDQPTEIENANTGPLPPFFLFSPGLCPRAARMALAFFPLKKFRCEAVPEPASSLPFLSWFGHSFNIEISYVSYPFSLSPFGLRVTPVRLPKPSFFLFFVDRRTEARRATWRPLFFPPLPPGRWRSRELLLPFFSIVLDMKTENKAISFSFFLCGCAVGPPLPFSFFSLTCTSISRAAFFFFRTGT